MRLILGLGLPPKRQGAGEPPPPPLVTAIAVGVLLTRPLSIAGPPLDDDLLIILL